MNQSLGGVKNRRKKVLERLEAQLKGGHKVVKGSKLNAISSEPLTESDISRINREIEVLKSRI